MTRQPPRQAARREEVERMFAELIVEDVSQEPVGAEHHDDQYTGHMRYFPPWVDHVDGVAVLKGPLSAATWDQEWVNYRLRPFWNPPEAAVVADALTARQAAITELASRLLPQLTPAEAEVYRLHYVAGMSIGKIARLTNRHRGRVTKHLWKIKGKAKGLAEGGSR